MSQFLFEAYNIDTKGKVFLGYRKVSATSKEEAELILKERESNIHLCQVYFNFDN